MTTTQHGEANKKMEHYCDECGEIVSGYCQNHPEAMVISYEDLRQECLDEENLRCAEEGISGNFSPRRPVLSGPRQNPNDDDECLF